MKNCRPWGLASSDCLHKGLRVNKVTEFGKVSASSSRSGFAVIVGYCKDSRHRNRRAHEPQKDQFIYKQTLSYEPNPAVEIRRPFCLVFERAILLALATMRAPRPLASRQGWWARTKKAQSEDWAFFKSERRDLNPRRQPWQGCTLPLSYSRLSTERVLACTGLWVKSLVRAISFITNKGIGK